MRMKTMFACLALVIGGVAATPLKAEATTTQALTYCGQAITRDTAYLARDLTCAIGFVIPRYPDRSSSVSIDLKGHRLTGSGTGTAFKVGGDPPFFDSLKVSNGRVSHWDTAFSAVFAGLTVTKVQIDKNNVGVYCGGGGCTIEDSAISNNASGTKLNSAALRMNRNLIIGNEIGSNAFGPALAGAFYTYNAFTNNKIGVNVAPRGGAQLSKNVFTGNGTGVKGTPSADGEGWSADLVENLFVANVDGVHLTLSLDRDETATLRGNVALRNTRHGFYAPGATDGGGNKAAGNGRPCVGVVCTKP